MSGSKIFISGGEHDLTDNIIHLVLARLPDAPPGPKGLSLFLVPKFLPDGTRNAVHCDRIEEKMGLHGSPTCAMRFDGATGWIDWRARARPERHVCDDERRAPACGAAGRGPAGCGLAKGRRLCA
jgi:alkylation response protein AidB-like acyl-CoA dehydrogenase